MMNEVWLFVLGTLAAYRVTRLVVADKIAEPYMERVRWWLERRWFSKHPDEDGSQTEWNSRLAYMLSCPWCFGFWVSGATTVILSVAYGLSYPVIAWLAMSTAIGFLGRIDSD